MATPTETQDGHTDLGATPARQGRYGRHMFWVLVISTLLAAVALVGAWAFRAGDLASTEPNNASQPQDAAPYDAPPPAPRQDTPAT